MACKWNIYFQRFVSFIRELTGSSDRKHGTGEKLGLHAITELGMLCVNASQTAGCPGHL